MFESTVFETSLDTVSVVIADGELTGLSFHVEFVGPTVTSGEEDEVRYVAEYGIHANLGPGVVTLTGDDLSGSIDVAEYQTFGEGVGCSEDLVREDPGRYRIEATIDGDVISGAIIDPDGRMSFQARR